MAQRFFNPAPQFFYSGTPAAPLSGGLVYFYEPGTTTPKDTYSDNALTTPNSNPVVLTSSGVLPNVFLDGPYKVNVTDKNGVQQPTWPRDFINSSVEMAFGAWDSTVTYGDGGTNIVTASNGLYYISIQANNLAHEPSASAAWWEEVQFLGTWNANITYADDDIAELDGIIYRSAQGSNTNHDPSTDTAGTWWRPPNFLDEQIFTASGTWTKPAGAQTVFVEVWGAGGGGGGGFANSTGNTRTGGGGGGGATRKWAIYAASELSSTVAVTIGASGAGGAGSASDGAAAANGSNGGNSSFGTLLISYGGGGGVAGSGAGSAAAGGFGGPLSAASGTTDGTPAQARNIFASRGGDANSGAPGSAGECAVYGGVGGGGGGSVSSGDSASAGGAGGSNAGASGGGGAGGAATGAAGAAGSTIARGGGGGGGNLGAGGVGGAGGRASGGGGGGAAQGAAAGAGGAGGGGYVEVKSW